MREIRKVLDLFANESAMDYCQDFDDIKSVLEYCNKHVKPFKRLHFRSGNEAVINELTNRFLEIFMARQYVDEESFEPIPKAYAQLRKILMFLIANTDITYKYDLRQDENYAHITEICPLMPKFLLMAMIWDLKLDKFFFEMLNQAPYWLAFQYFEMANESLKYVEDPYEVLKKLQSLLEALFMCITRMDRQHIDLVDCRVTCNKLYDACTNMLRLFYTPDSEKFKNFKRKQKQRYTGYLMLHLLRCVKFLFDVYENGKITEPANETVAFYNVCANMCPFVEAQKSHKINETIKEQQHKIISAVLNSLQYNLLLVNVEAFIYWVELDVDDDMTLQQCIGELAYEIGQRMQANAELNHDLSAQLQMIALKPKTIEEIVQEATIGEILLALEKDSLPMEEQHKWLDELITRNVSLGNEECLQTIKENVQLLQVQNIKDMLQYLKALQAQQMQIETVDEEETDETSAAASTLTCNTTEAAATTTTTTSQCETLEDMQIDAEEWDELTSIILLALSNFNEAQLIELLIYELELFGAGTQIFCLSASEFKLNLNKFLHKHNTVENFDMRLFLNICFERPQLAWQELFQNACNMPESLKVLAHVLERAKPLTAYFIPHLLEETICDTKKLHQPLATQLLNDIYFLLYHPAKSQDFLEHYLHKHIKQMFDNENFTDLLPVLTTLNKIARNGETQSYKPLNFGNFTCPMLLTVAGVLDMARWNLINYTQVRHQLVCECIDFIQYNNKHFLPTASDCDRQFLSIIAQDRYSSFVQYYFQKYSLQPAEKPKHFDEFIVTEDCSTFEVTLSTLLMNIIRCTKKETEWLARSERFLPLFGDAMIMLSIVVEETEAESQSAALQNYRRCLANFGLVVQKFMLPAAKDNIENLDALLFKVLKVIAAIPKTIYDETFLSILWLPLEIVETYMKDINFELYKRIISFMGTVNESKAKSLFCEKLEALVSK